MSDHYLAPHLNKTKRNSTYYHGMDNSSLYGANLGHVFADGPPPLDDTVEEDDNDIVFGVNNAKLAANPNDINLSSDAIRGDSTAAVSAPQNNSHNNGFQQESLEDDDFGDFAGFADFSSAFSSASNGAGISWDNVPDERSIESETNSTSSHETENKSAPENTTSTANSKSKPTRNSSFGCFSDSDDEFEEFDSFQCSKTKKEINEQSEGDTICKVGDNIKMAESSAVDENKQATNGLEVTSASLHDGFGDFADFDSSKDNHQMTSSDHPSNNQSENVDEHVSKKVNGSETIADLPGVVLPDVLPNGHNEGDSSMDDPSSPVDNDDGPVTFQQRDNEEHNTMSIASTKKTIETISLEATERLDDRISSHAMSGSSRSPDFGVLDSDPVDDRIIEGGLDEISDSSLGGSVDNTQDNMETTESKENIQKEETITNDNDMETRTRENIDTSEDLGGFSVHVDKERTEKSDDNDDDDEFGDFGTFQSDIPPSNDKASPESTGKAEASGWNSDNSFPIDNNFTVNTDATADDFGEFGSSRTGSDDLKTASEEPLAHKSTANDADNGCGDSISSPNVTNVFNVPNQNNSSNINANNHTNDDFGDFSNFKSNSNNITPGDDDDDDNDDFGGFSNFESSVQTPPNDDEDDFGSFSSSKTPPTLASVQPINNKQQEPVECGDDFGSFPSLKAQPTSTPAQPLNNKQEEPVICSNDFGDFGSFSSSKTQPTSASVPPTNNNDDFGDFGSADADNTDDGFAEFSSADTSSAFANFPSQGESSSGFSDFTRGGKSSAPESGWDSGLSGAKPDWTTTGSSTGVASTSTKTTLQQNDNKQKTSSVFKPQHNAMVSKVSGLFGACFLGTEATQGKGTLVELLQETVHTTRASVWTELSGSEKNGSLRFDWVMSSHQNKLLESLTMLPVRLQTSASFQSSSKSSFPMFVVGLGLLEPTKGKTASSQPSSQDTNTLTLDPFGALPDTSISNFTSSNGLTKSAITKSAASLDIKDNSSDTASSESSSLDLDFLATAGQTAENKTENRGLYEDDLLGLSLQSSGSNSTSSSPALPSLGGEAKKVFKFGNVLIPLGGNLGNRELSESAKKVVNDFEDLSFMRSKVLMFPLKSK